MKLATLKRSGICVAATFLFSASALAETGIGYISGNTFKHKEVVFENRDGRAFFEGDIVLGTVEELQAPTTGLGFGIQSGVVTGNQYRWPDNTLPYQFAADVSPEFLAAYRQSFTAAAQHYNDHTNIRVVERTPANAHLYPDYVEVVASDGCWSYVGRQGGKQTLGVYFAYGQQLCSDGAVIHELGHSIGLWHEQGREDRDAYVTIHWENIQDGYAYAFDQHITDGDDVGPYDYASIMHYGETAFSKNGQKTITPNDPNARIGLRDGLSPGDIAALNSLYPPLAICPGLPSPSNLTFSNIGTTGFTAHWTAAAGADTYLIDTLSEGQFRTWLATSGTSYNFSGFAQGTYVGVRVQAQKNGCGVSAEFVSDILMTSSCQGAPATPDGVTHSNVTTTGFKLQWNAVAGAKNYTVETLSEGKFKTFTTTNTQLQLDGFDRGVYVAFNIKAHSENCGSSEGFSNIILLAQGGNFEANNIAAGLLSWKRYSINVPTGMSKLTVTLQGGSGNASLYVRANQAPNLISYSCRSAKSGNNEICEINNPTAGTWHVGIYAGLSSVSGTNLKVEWRP